MKPTAVPLLCLGLVLFQRDISVSTAFSLSSKIITECRYAFQPTLVASPRTTKSVLYMAEEGELSEGDDESVDESASDDNDPVEEETPPEDPEVTALKESIAELESNLAGKKSKLQYELEKCEEYSKSGYARKVADMENMKRVRSNIASSTQASATAAVLKGFLPIFDKFNNLKESNLEDEFGSKYTELNLQQTFLTLGVTDFNVEAGQKVDNFRMKVLESEVSTEQPKDTVVRQVAPGMEIDGNVIRAALCVSSAGAEEDSEEPEGDAESTSE